MHGLQSNKKTNLEVISNGVRIHSREEGGGEPTLVFLHYRGGSVSTWAGVIDELSKEYRTVAISRVGRLRGTFNWLRNKRSRGRCPGRVVALGLQRYVLVGHSMGGKVAQVASRRPMGLEGLVLVALRPLRR